ncbi:MAG: hypothetical protein U5L96_10805 [Owenweeksia sp.]|nr:hypothetical protein [Owenweeksia sp.]
MNREAVENLVKNGKLRGQAINPKVTETHISWVLFSRDYALKIKKPEKLSFLDFSSLEKRKYYCEEELRLNSRLASVYLQVLPVIEQSGQLYVPQAKTQKGIDNKLKQNAQENPVVDYGVLMEKLPAESQNG